MPEEYVEKNYERDTLPDPSRYYVKDLPGYQAMYYEVQVIMSKYTRQVYAARDTTPPAIHVYACELCKKVFDTADDPSQHVSTRH